MGLRSISYNEISWESVRCNWGQYKNSVVGWTLQKVRAPQFRCARYGCRCLSRSSSYGLATEVAWASTPVEERRLLSDLPGRLNFRQRLSTPEIAEQLDRRWPITREVVICKSQNHDAALVHFL
jgi:hypothetical protein